MFGDAYVAFHSERARAHEKHKDEPGGSMEMKGFDDLDWLPVITEELGEVAKALNDFRHGLLDDDEMRADVRSEVVQVGEMEAAGVAAIDGGGG